VALTSRMLESTDDLGPHRAEWDELAVAAHQPFGSPAWALAWWDNLRPRKAKLRLVIVQEGDRLAGIVPLFSSGRSYRPLAGGLAPAEPLSRPGLEREVAAAAVATLAESVPRPATIELELHGSSPAWAELLGEAWLDGRGAWRWAKSDTPVPRVALVDDFDAWMETRSTSFRREMRRKRRKLESAGGAFRHATEGTLENDVHTFLRLHRSRLAGQGGTNLTADGIEQMLIAVGADLLPSGRFRLLCLELDGKPIAMQLLLAGGGEVSAWNTGFDEAYAKLSPVMQCMVHSIADAAERGERMMSFGPGGQDYKYRLSNDEDSLLSHVLVPPGVTYPLARCRLAPAQVRYGLSGRLSPEAKQRLRRLVHR
jgi:CelD/BcsL family acetyltransferase involved in cellulose biosynthesis